VTLGLGVALETLEPSTGAEGGVLEWSRNPGVSACHHRRGCIRGLLRHVGSAGCEGCSTVVLNVPFVRLQRNPTLVLR